MAQLRQQTGGERVVDVNHSGAHHVGLRQREVDIVLAVDAMLLNLRGAGVGKGEGVAILARRNGNVHVGSGRIRGSGFGRNDVLPIGILRHAGRDGLLGVGECAPPMKSAAMSRRPAGRAMESEPDFLRLSIPVGKQALEGGEQTVHGDLEDAAEAVQYVIALARLAPAKPGIGAGVKDHGQGFLRGDG